MKQEANFCIFNQPTKGPFGECVLLSPALLIFCDLRNRPWMWWIYLSLSTERTTANGIQLQQYQRDGFLLQAHTIPASLQRLQTPSDQQEVPSVAMGLPAVAGPWLRGLVDAGRMGVSSPGWKWHSWGRLDALLHRYKARLVPFGSSFTFPLCPFEILHGRHTAITVAISCPISDFFPDLWFFSAQRTQAPIAQLCCLLPFSSPIVHEPRLLGRGEQSRASGEIKHFMLSTFNTVLNVL